MLRRTLRWLKLKSLRGANGKPQPISPIIQEVFDRRQASEQIEEVTGALKIVLTVITALLIVGFDSFLPLWLAALIVTVLWFAVAAALGLSGKKAIQSATPPVPQTIETVKEDIQWSKHPTTSAPR